MSAHYPRSAIGHERLYRCWSKMRERCTNPRSDSFKNYGARGVAVCPEWGSFDAFKAWALSNGYAAHLTIERRDGAKGYAPSNCTWATRTEQNRNRRNVRKDASGQALCVAALGNGVNESTYRNRLRRGWSPERAASESTDTRFSTKKPTVSLGEDGKVHLSEGAP